MGYPGSEEAKVSKGDSASMQQDSYIVIYKQLKPDLLVFLEVKTDPLSSLTSGVTGFLCLDVVQQLLHAAGDRLEVVQVSLLMTGRQLAEERAAGVHQVGASLVVGGAQHEELLLPSQVAEHALGIGADSNVLQEAQAVEGHCIHGAQQRRLLIDALSEVRHEGARDVQALVHHEGRRGPVPGGESCCGVGHSQASVRKRGQAFMGFVVNFEPNSRSMRVSFLKAPSMPPTAPPPPRRGKNQCAKSIAPRSRAHVNIVSAITFMSSCHDFKKSTCHPNLLKLVSSGCFWVDRGSTTLKSQPSRLA